MKVLIVDDDMTTRLFLSRLLSRKLGCETIEAADGLEGLLKVQEHAPDLVIMDVNMPVVDGKEMLEAIRKDPVYANLPVIILSVVDEKQKVAELITHGISDYILKPLWSGEVQKRVSKVLSRIRSARMARKGEPQLDQSNGREKILIVDGDLHFRMFFRSMLGDRFDILESKNGAEGLRMVREHQPKIVCISEGVAFLSEQVLAHKIRTLQIVPRPSIYLLVSAQVPEEIVDAPYDGVLKKSFVPNVFLKEFMATVLREKSLHELALEIIHKHLPAELATATMQTFGVMSTQEVAVLDKSVLPSLTSEVCTVVDLVDHNQDFLIRVGLFASQRDALAVAERILGGPVGYHEGAEDAFGELCNTIGGRIRSSVEARGIRLQQTPPRVYTHAEQGQPIQWDVAIPVQTPTGEKYGVGVAYVPQSVRSTSLT
jgi:CheY-like chemotaxis protein/CheY-specific phosphatase CheX